MIPPSCVTTSKRNGDVNIKDDGENDSDDQENKDKQIKIIVTIEDSCAFNVYGSHLRCPGGRPSVSYQFFFSS